jgi:hypothetical protein
MMPDLHDPANVRTLTYDWDEPRTPPAPSPAEQACWILGILSLFCLPVAIAASSGLLFMAGMALGVSAAGLPGRKWPAVLSLVLHGVLLVAFLVGAAYLAGRQSATHDRAHPVYSDRP